MSDSPRFIRNRTATLTKGSLEPWDMVPRAVVRDAIRELHKGRFYPGGIPVKFDGVEVVPFESTSTALYAFSAVGRWNLHRIDPPEAWRSAYGASLDRGKWAYTGGPGEVWSIGPAEYQEQLCRAVFPVLLEHMKWVADGRPVVEAPGKQIPVRISF